MFGGMLDQVEKAPQVPEHSGWLLCLYSPHSDAASGLLHGKKLNYSLNTDKATPYGTDIKATILVG